MSEELKSIEIDLNELPRETLEQIIIISAKTGQNTEEVIIDLLYRAVEKLEFHDPDRGDSKT